MNRKRTWIGVAAGLLTLLASGPLAAQPRPGGAQPEGKHRSPVEAIGRMLDQLEKQGKDVSALKAELASLKPEWESLQNQRKALEKRMRALGPKFQSLARKASRLGGGESPLEGLEKGLSQLEKYGEDVSGLRAELEAIRPDWTKLKEMEKDLDSTPEAEREAKARAVRAFAEGTVAPRVHALAEKVQAAMKGLQGRKQGG